MKKIIFYILVLNIFAYGTSCRNNNIRIKRLSGLGKALTGAIENTVKKRIYKDVSIGISITTVDGKHNLYSLNPDRTYITASAFKIIPSAVAIIKLGPEYRFKTPLMTDGMIEGEILKGNLYIKGTGDPSLKLSDIREAVKKLKKKGISRISGDVIYDTTFLDEERNRYEPNARNLYAPPSALNINYNWIDVVIRKGPPPELRLVPPTSYAKLEYDIKISHSATPGRPEMRYKKYNWGDYYTIKGTITGWDRKYHYVWLGVSRPGLYAATLLKETCENEGIRISGIIKKKKVPGNAKILVNMLSVPLKVIVKVMNQESNNVIAETINKDLGAIFISAPGTREKGISVLKDFFIKELNIAGNDFSIGDASGLSVNNRFTPAHFIKALNYFYNKDKIRSIFLSTLARQGHHPHAMVPVPPDNIKILVKTGTLSVSGVNTVAGYIIIEQINEVFSFVIFANRFKPGPMTYSGTLTNPLLKEIVKAFKENIS